MTDLLSKEHTILERPFMEHRPFGVDERGEKIRDVSGMIVRSNLEYLKEYLTRTVGPHTGDEAVEKLCLLLNDRIREPAYHVTPVFLKNVWNSYSYEFVSFLREFCQMLSGDPQFHFNVGKERNLPPTLQILGRPFSVSQIYSMWPHFGQKFAKGSIEFSLGEVTDSSAILRMKFTHRVFDQFGPYRRRCAEMACQSSKGGLLMVPERIHGLPSAAVSDRSCMAEGDEYCEWEFTWSSDSDRRFMWPVWGLLASGAAFAYLRFLYPQVAFPEALAIALFPSVVSWLGAYGPLQQEIRSLKELIQEQDKAVDARHEELREVYLEQQRTSVELGRKVNQLTTLHRAGLLFSSTLDHEKLLHNVLETIVDILHYDRAMFAFYDSDRRISYGFHIRGVSEDVAVFARTLEVPVTDSESVEGTVLWKGEPILVGDIQEEWDRLHPRSQQLISALHAKSVLSVPLKVKDRILGSLAVNCTRKHALTQDDRDLMVTLAGQVAIALDNAEAYSQIETLNLRLETRVRERTAQLEAANEQLKQMDRLKSQFLAHVSHELRTPLTSITGFTDNMLEGLAGSLSEKQQQYLTRMKANGGRLARMIANLLDLSRIEAGKLELTLEDVALTGLVSDVVEQIRPLALTKHQRLQFRCDIPDMTVWGDSDRLSQIVTNLVDNAVKYTPDGGSVTVGVCRDGVHFAQVSVADNGPGIPPDALPRLFDPFFRVSGHERSQIKGLGLGLSIVKELVELHGGSISVQSDEGKTTEFRFTIPVRRGSEKRLRRAATSIKRILVVDDDTDIRQLLRDRLESDGYVVEAVVDGREALETLGKVDIHGLILDVGVPDVDGLEILRRVREKQPGLPVVMMTAIEGKERVLMAMEAGAQAYLLKPFDSAQVHSVVERWFGPDVGRMPGGDFRAKG